MQLGQRTVEQRQEGFLDDYERICLSHGMILDQKYGAHEMVRPELFKLHLQTIRLRMDRRKREIEKHH